MSIKNPSMYIVQYKKTEPLKDIVQLNKIKEDYPVCSVYQVATKEDEANSKTLNKKYFALWILNWILFWLLWVSLFLGIYSTNATVVLWLWIMFLVNILLILIRLNTVLYKEWELIEKTDEDFDFYKNRYVITYYIDDSFEDSNKITELKNSNVNELLVVKRLDNTEADRVNKNQEKNVRDIEKNILFYSIYSLCIVLLLILLWVIHTPIFSIIITINLLYISFNFIYLWITKSNNEVKKEWDYHIVEYKS